MNAYRIKETKRLIKTQKKLINFAILIKFLGKIITKS